MPKNEPGGTPVQNLSDLLSDNAKGLLGTKGTDPVRQIGIIRKTLRETSFGIAPAHSGIQARLTR